MKHWLIVGVSVVVAAAGWFSYQTIADHSNEAATMFPAERKDIPLLDGLKPQEHEFVMEGDHWEKVHHFYLHELPAYGWSLAYLGSALEDDDPENDWGGFYSRWKKAGFAGTLRISAHYNRFTEQTEVSFDIYPDRHALSWSELPQ